MVKYSSKRLKKCHKKTRKRLSYKRKKSMKNKILYGGSIYALKFESNGTIYELIKDKSSLNFISGYGKYKLRELENSNTEIISETDLLNFIDQLISLPNSDILYRLYKELTKEYERKDSSFNFKSLYDRLCSSILRIEDIVHNKITITDFTQLLSNTIGAKDISDLLSFEETNILKLKDIYDNLIKLRDLPSLVDIYRDIPLFKINYNLPTLYDNLPQKDVVPLGTGSFGAVYKVEIDGKKYALKVITKEHNIENIPSIMNGEVIAYNTISQLVCDNDNKSFCKFISTYLDFSNNHIYVLMEYCGISLQNNMYNRSITDVSPLHIYKWLLHIAEGLQCMHKNKYAHLDIKPDNIVLDENLNSKLIDFGLTFNYLNPDYQSQLNSVGTRDFMSPEMINRSVLSVEKCDVYSLGITFIECAFALHYRDVYIDCFKKDASLSLLTSLLRYIPLEDELKLSPQIPVTLTLSLPVTNSDGNIAINDITYKISDTITTYHRQNTPFKYNLKDLYLKIIDIHKNYPLFREMIKINPLDRCDINHIIAECHAIILK